jgi:hypothetical protein
LRFSFVCLPYFSPFSLLRTCTVQACQFDSYRAVQTHFFLLFSLSSSYRF